MKRKRAPFATPDVPVRRSERRLGRDPPNYREDSITTLSSPRSSAALSDVVDDDLVKSAPMYPARKSYTPPLPSPGSVRATDADMQKLLRSFLGRAIPDAYTKAVVVNAMSGPGGIPRFNKYQGVLEWRNVILLWVNIGGKDYSNLFLDGGRRLTFFAGSKMHADTPAVKRLLSSKANDGVVLFCRVKPGPYVFCGRLALDDHDATALPLKFVWKLADYDEMIRVIPIAADDDTTIVGEATDFPSILQAASDS